MKRLLVMLLFTLFFVLVVGRAPAQADPFTTTTIPVLTAPAITCDIIWLGGVPYKLCHEIKQAASKPAAGQPAPVKPLYAEGTLK